MEYENSRRSGRCSIGQVPIATWAGFYLAVVPYAIPSNTLIHHDCSLTKKELGRKWAALLGRECRSSAKPCDSTIYFRRVTRKRLTVCSSASMSTGLDRCASIPASLLFCSTFILPKTSANFSSELTSLFS